MFINQQFITMNCVKRLNHNIIFFFLSFAVLLSCAKEEKSSKEIARVNEVSLTEEELNSQLNEDANKAKFREEFIQQWIESEILYQAAVENGITKSSEFNSSKEKAEKEIAISLFIQKILQENASQISNDEITKYYDKYLEDFRLEDDAYKLNIGYFNNFDQAVKFRSILIDSDWKKVVNTFKGDLSLVLESQGKICYPYNFPSTVIAKTTKNLQPGEVSVVIETEPNQFAIVQLVDRLSKGTIPPMNVIEPKVKERLMIVKQKEFVRDYIDKLIEDYNVEIKRYEE